jgi:hypothetical protein
LRDFQQTTWPRADAWLEGGLRWRYKQEHWNSSNMSRVILVAALAAFLGGCVHVDSSTGADGRPQYTIDCNGEPSSCFDKAGKLCPGGYYLVERRSGSSEVPYTGGIIAAPTTRLVIECK